MKPNKNPENIRNMFNKISLKYDFINNMISFGTHYKIKEKCIKNLEIKSGDRILDLCTGTGDLCEIIRKKYKNVKIIGADFSEDMLDIARKRNSDIEYIRCDASNLPFEDNSFDIVTMSFGLRNIFFAEKAVEEVFRVLKKDGKFLHLDFGKKNIFSRIFDIVVLFMTKLLSKNHKAYSYLINSKKHFPAPDDLIKDFKSKGFILEKRKDYLFGIISCQIMQKEG